MKRSVKSGLILLICCFVMLCIPLFAHAESAKQDGLAVNVITDKDNYASDETALVTVSVTNTNAMALYNVALSTVIPKGLTVVTNDNAALKISQLNAGETKTYSYHVKKALNAANAGNTTVNGTGKNDSENVSTGTTDTPRRLLAAFLLILLAFVMLFAFKKRKANILCLLLVLGLGAAMATVSTVQAQNVQKSFQVNKNVVFGQETYAIQTKVTYETSGDNADTGEVSREAWISALADKTSISLQEKPVNYSFDDYASAQNPEKIEAAIQYSVLSLKADQDNMVYFKPKNNATREFVASTAIKALGYQINTSEASPTWSDSGDLAYPHEDQLAVKLGIMKTVNGSFLPNQPVTMDEMNTALAAIQKVNDSTKVSNDYNNTVNYAAGVKQSTSNDFTIDETAKTVTMDENAEVAQWQKGEVHVLHNAADSGKDIALRVVSIETANGKTIIHYEDPELKEVVSSADVEGSQSQKGTFTPAAGVTVESSDSEVSTQASGSGEVPLFGKTKVKLTGNLGDDSSKTMDIEIAMDIKSLEYRFVIDPSWNASNAVKEAYIAMNSSYTFTVSQALHGTKNTESKEFKIGEVDVPLYGPVNASGEIYLQIAADGSVQLTYQIDAKNGVQYNQADGFRPINSITGNPKDLKLEAGIKIGPEVRIGAKLFTNIDLVLLGAESGLGVKGSAYNLNLNPFQICLDVKAYNYLTFFTQIGPDNLKIRLEKDIFTADFSPWKTQLHIEETGIVPECTRGNGKYAGVVKQAQNTDLGISNAKIEVYFANGDLADRTYSDDSGNFTGINLPKGTYKVRVSASGYLPYENTFDIVGGATTTLEPQLMVSRGASGQTHTCSGTVTNAYTGGAEPNVQIKVYSLSINSEANTPIATVETDASGNYSFTAPAGNYNLVASKTDFVTTTESVALASNVTNKNFAINPKNQPVISDALRIVLTWGSKPSDLDSHLVGSNGHIFYKQMNTAIGTLDTDDRSSYGPETITMASGDTGSYGYYVHDYTNMSSENSKALSNSGAKIRVYSGNVLIRTIDVPTGEGGTLLHVFDYNASTKTISLVNEYSYQDNPWNVGGSSSVSSQSTENMDISK